MKKLVSWLLAVILMLSVMPMSLLTVYAQEIDKAVTAATDNATEFAGGDGTEENPYLIADKTHLDNVRYYLDAHFEMTADIAFTEADFAEGGKFYHDGKGWQPIGADHQMQFVGTFDGSGHTINGLRADEQGIDQATYVGLFGYNAGTIKNLGMSDSRITSGHSYVGGIAGYNYRSGTIIGCYNTGFITSTASPSNAGGIAGINSGTISDCHNTGSVASASARSNTGGIVGSNAGAISDCYNIGSITAASANSNAGGIAGDNSETINSCYNTGSITAAASPSYAGGIAGKNLLGRTISNCYNIGSISGSCAGGIAGENDYMISHCYNAGSIFGSDAGGITGKNTKMIDHCYYLDIISQGTGGNMDTAIKCTQEEMTGQDTFAGFDFDTIWTMAGNEDYLYPELQNIPMPFKKELASISVTPPTKKEYLLGKETLDLTDGKVILQFNNGATETIDLTDDMVSGFDNTKIGPQAIKVTYGGFEAIFEVEIVTDQHTSHPIPNPKPPQPEEFPFTDVKESNYFYNSVQWAVENGITAGTDKTHFSPKKPCTRAQAITFLWKAAGSPEPLTENDSFTDVSTDKYYYNAVQWAVENGITAGTDKTHFSPNKPCTRGQVVTFMYNAANRPPVASTNSPFTDVSADKYYYNAVQWAAENGITSGTTPKTFSPNKACTRAQIVTLLYNGR